MIEFMSLCADHNATTPLCPAARTAMTEAFECWGNPSSSHALGRKSRALLEDARESVARAAGAKPTEVVFTSGGSEANGLALTGSRYLNPDFRMLTSPVEHSSIRDALKFLRDTGARVELLPVDGSGNLDLKLLAERLREFRPHLVSLMTANNETGVIFPIREVAALCKEAGAVFHTDAVQALGKLDPELWAGADLVSVSAHKVHGPKGVGALIVRSGRKLVPTHFGGSQEVKRRGGTENLIGIAGFGAACRELPTPVEYQNRVRPLRDAFEQALFDEPAISVNGRLSERLANTSNVRFDGIAAEVLLGALDLEGISVSAGSACSSGSISPSHVLIEMGLSHEEARQCLRFSFSRDTTPADIERLTASVLAHVRRIRARSQS